MQSVVAEIEKLEICMLENEIKELHIQRDLSNFLISWSTIDQTDRGSRTAKAAYVNCRPICLTVRV